MFKLIFISSTSACFELCNEQIFYNDKKYSVSLNGNVVSKNVDTNVFSLFDLSPDTEYTVGTSLDGFTLKFKTDSETASISVKDFNAQGDGVTLDTQAIQSAINVCPKGGRIYFPKGTYLSGSLTLKSDITLDLEQGAKILGSPDTKDYPILPGELKRFLNKQSDKPEDLLQVSTWEGEPRTCYQPLISAYNASNIKIVGLGEIDGNGHNGVWWVNHSAQRIGRPRLFFINNCEGVSLHGITASNSASWTLHPFFSKKVGIYDTRVKAPKDSPNTDGCNPESCDGVDIIGVIFSVGDDCIAIKSGKIYMGAKYKTPARNYTIRNCLMQFGHGGVVLGSEMSGGVKDLNVTRCIFNRTDRGLRIKTRRGRGKDAIIDGITFDNVKMDGVLSPLVINMFYHCCDPDGKTEYVWSKEKLPVDERTPYLGKFTFKNVHCTNCEQAAGFFYGLPEQPIEEVNLENVSFEFKKDAQKGMPAMMCKFDPVSKLGLYFNNVKRVNINNAVVKGQEGDSIVAQNIESIKGLDK